MENPVKKKAVYIGHSREFDYENELYAPLKASELAVQYHFIFPHDENGDEFISSRDLKDVDLFVAEVSFPSLGLGIELGFSHLYGVKTVCLHKTTSKVTSALKHINCTVLTYNSTAELLERIKNALLQI